MRKPKPATAAAEPAVEPEKKTAATEGECDCCANDSKPCNCPSKDQTSDGVCSCTADCPNCVENDCDGEIEDSSAPATNTGAAASGAPPRAASRKAEASPDEVADLRAQVAQLQHANITKDANAMIETAVRELKMPPLPATAKGGQVQAETLSSLLRDTLVDSKANTGCSTCQASHGRTVKVIALMPPAVPTGRLNVKPVRETSSIVGGSTTAEQGDLHMTISQQLASKGLKPGSRKYAKAYRELLAEMNTAAASAT